MGVRMQVLNLARRSAGMTAALYFTDDLAPALFAPPSPAACCASIAGTSPASGSFAVCG